MESGGEEMPVDQVQEEVDHHVEQARRYFDLVEVSLELGRVRRTALEAKSIAEGLRMSLRLAWFVLGALAAEVVMLRWVP